MGPAATRAAPARKAMRAWGTCILVEVCGCGSVRGLCGVGRRTQVEGRALRVVIGAPGDVGIA